LRKHQEYECIYKCFRGLVLGDYQVQWLVKTYKDKIMQSFIKSIRKDKNKKNVKTLFYIGGIYKC